MNTLAQEPFFPPDTCWIALTRSFRVEYNLVDEKCTENLLFTYIDQKCFLHPSIKILVLPKVVRGHRIKITVVEVYNLVLIKQPVFNYV